MYKRQADLSGGRDALAAAFTGATSIFALTDFWQTQSTVIEIAQGRAIADAAAQTTTLKHFVWSALPDPVKLSGGKFMNVHHWKGKSLVTEYIQSTHPGLWAKTTTVLFPNYFENCLTTPERYLPTKVSAPRDLRYLHLGLSANGTDEKLLSGCFRSIHFVIPAQPADRDAERCYFGHRQACASHPRNRIPLL